MHVNLSPKRLGSEEAGKPEALEVGSGNAAFDKLRRAKVGKGN